MGISNAPFPMLSIYDGRQCVGFVLARGRRGFEAFTAAETSLGLFETRDAAVDECVKRNGGER